MDKIQEVFRALREYDEYAAPTERWQSTGQLIREAADTLEKLQAELQERREQVDDYQQDFDEIVIALGSKGLLWKQIVPEIEKLQAENDTFRGLIGQMMLRCSDNGVAIDDLFVVANGEIYPVAAMEDEHKGLTIERYEDERGEPLFRVTGTMEEE